MSQRCSGYERQANDHYPTPPWVVQIVAGYLRKHCKHVWAPADDEASPLVRTLATEGFHVVASIDDFLRKDSLPDARITAVVTNPPWGPAGKLACAFIEHAVKLAPVTAMLLKIDFDSAKTRTPLFRDCPAFAGKIILLDRIVWFQTEGAPGPSENHAWFIWNARHKGLPTIAYARRPLAALLVLIPA
jgi:hypothetical protein